MAQKIPYRVELQLVNRLEEIPTLHARMEQLGEELDLSPEVVNAVNLSLDEVLTNLVMHGFDDDAEHHIDVRVALLDDDQQLRLEVEDDGRPFNPLEEAPEPDTQASLDERAIGGLGIFLVRQMMDHLEYRRVDGRNLLILVKSLQENAADTEE